MKRNSIAAAILAGLALPAYAQSSVTLYGVIDEGLQLNTNAKNVVNGHNVGGRLWNLDSLSGPWGSRWGIRGTEDLGNGLSTVFDLESGTNINSGTFGQGNTLFGRQAYVGLRSQQYGGVLLGRQYDSIADYVASFTFGLADYGNAVSHPGDLDNAAHNYRMNNSIKYSSPNLNGLTFGGLVMAGGVAGSVSQNSGYSLGAGYHRGPLALGAAYQMFKNPSSVGGALNGNSNAVAPASTTIYGSINSGYLSGAHPATSWQVAGVGGSYDFGRFLLAAEYSNIRYGNIGNLNGASATVNDLEVNGMYRFTPAMFLGLAYNYMKGNAVSGDLGDQTYHQIEGLLDYAISKRSDFYFSATYQLAHGTNSLGAPAVADISLQGDSSNNRQAFFRVGFRHKF